MCASYHYRLQDSQILFWTPQLGNENANMNRTRNQADHELKARARIYVANIPAAGMTRKEVVSVFHKYGEIDSKLYVNI